MGLYPLTPKAKYKSYKGDRNGTVKNLLLKKVVDEEKQKTIYKRNFNTTSRNEIWSTDVSKFHIGAGKQYLSPNFEQTKDMLDKALSKHKHLEGLIFHSDQGWQYQMDEYHKVLKDKGIIQSMSRKGNCFDNSPMENFFGKMKNEMFYGFEYTFKSLDELQNVMEDYKDKF